MPDMTLTLKGRNGDTLAKTQFTSIYSTLATAAISGVDHTLVAMNTVNSDGEERMLTGYVENSVLAQLDVTNVQLPSNFAGLEGQVIPTRLKEQLFEITNVVEGDDYVEITAQHIFYRLRQNTTLWEANESLSYTCAAVCRNVVTNAMFDAQVYVASDCTDTMSGKDLDYARLNIVEAFLNPESGICKKFGLSIIRDNDVFYCLKYVGYDRGFVVQDGKNLLGVERTVNIENTVTRLAPVARDEDGNIVWLNYNGLKYVDSPHVTDYSRPKLGIFDTGLRIGKDGVTTDNVQAKLLEAAQKQFTENQVDLPAVTMTIQFLSLGDTEEYSQYRNLDKVYLYDILSIKDSVRGYSYQAEVVGVEHDILTGRLNAVTIGTLQDWDGIRKVATWQVPEVNGEKIRLKSIQAGSFQTNVIGASEIRSGAIQSQHFSNSADNHFETIFAEQLYISNTSPDGLLNTRFSVTEGLISAEVVRATEAEGTLSGRLTVTENDITAEVTRATEAEGTLSGRITVEAGKITQIVSSVGADGEVTAASIVLAINESTGQSEAKIDAQHVYIGNSKSTTVIEGKLNASQFNATNVCALVGSVAQLTVNGLNVLGDCYVRNSGGSSQNVSAAIWDLDLQQNGNTYTLRRRRIQDGDWVVVGSFNRATSQKVSGFWSGAVYTVGADENGYELPVSMTIGVNATTKSGSYSDEFYVYAATPNGSSWDNHASKSGQIALNSAGTHAEVIIGGVKVAQLSTSSIYNSGYADGYPSGTITIGSKVTGTVYNVSISPTSGNALATTKDFSSIYADARVGYTQGTFNLASVTLQGSSAGLCYPALSSGGTVYYTAGSAVTLYKGDGGSYTVQGSSAGTCYPAVSSGGTVYYTAGSAATYYRGNGTRYSQETRYKGGSQTFNKAVQGWLELYMHVPGAYVSVGAGYWYTSNENVESGTIYARGDSQSVLVQNNSGAFYLRGDSVSVTPISSTSIRVAAGATKYNAGTYSVVSRGNTQTVTPIGSSSIRVGSSATKYNAGSTISNTYYTKS